VNTCARGVSRFVPKTSGWLQASGGASRVCAGDELATPAGISFAYYLRLEQGRVTAPSASVVDALARALRLDVEATEYLHRLTSPSGSHRSPSAVETVADGLDQVIDLFPAPAVVVSRYLDVLAANPCARALSPEYALGENFLRWRLLDPAARELYIDWDGAMENVVSGSPERLVICCVYLNHESFLSAGVPVGVATRPVG
jgi:transcriptional regulator with XRE-family HTH domain